MTVSLAGDGSGVVTSSPAGIECGGEAFECVAEFETGTEVTLTAESESDLSTFIGWDGACTGSGACEVIMTENLEVLAEFDALVLDVGRDGDGGGSVISDPVGIECTDEAFDCWERYAEGTDVTLTATTDEVSVFLGWAGACTGTGPCVVAINEDVQVTAIFDTAWLVIEPTGDGTGVVTSDPEGIECGGDFGQCQQAYLPNTQVSLSAAPAADSVFTGWADGCTGTGTCEVILADGVTVAAGFDTAYVVASRSGDGSGTVSADAGELECPPTCVESYLPGTEVTLTATPAANAVFTGWSGACTGTDACVLTLDDDAQVQATFDTGRVAARTAGDGGGAVTSTPSGITCPGDCRESYLPGTQITLVAAPSGTSVFVGWSGGCSGTGACVVDAGIDPIVTATFDTARLNVSRVGQGAGAVTSEPTGIECGVDCSESFLPGTSVTLVAEEQAGSTFAGWSGACTGLGDCLLSMDGDLVVTATFNPPGVGGKIAYECDYDICVMNEDGTEQVNLTNTPDDQEYAPTLSKDGTKIAFMSNAALTGNPDRNIEIASMNVDGTGLIQVTNSSGPEWDADHNYDPDWSPDGTKIAFVASRGQLQRQIYTINADGTNETAITTAADQVTRLGPKWSPDGTKIAYTWWLGGQDVYVMNADGTGQTNLTPDTPWTRELSPSWSPEGTRIAFGTDRHYDPMTFNEEIYIVNADGTNFIRLTEHAAIDESPAWSPDGLWVAFSRYGDIYAVEAPPVGARVDGATEFEVKRLTSGSALELEPFWAGPAAPAQTHVVKVRKTGTGKGTVESTPAGIDCGRDCASAFLAGSRVNLVARASYGSVFVGWSVPCPSTGGCVITVDSAKEIKAQFKQVPVISTKLEKLR